MKNRFFSLFSVFSNFHRVFYDFKIKFAKIFNLKPVHLIIIYFIGSSTDGIMQKDLLDITMLDKGNLSRGLSYLYNRGIINEKKYTNTSCYKSLISLSGYGNEIYSRISDTLESVMSNIDPALDSNCLELFNSLILSINDFKEF